MEPLPRDTEYDNLTPAEYVTKWLGSNKGKSKADFRDHVRDRWNGSENELPAFEDAVTTAFDKRIGELKRIDDFQNAAQRRQFAADAERVFPEKDQPN